MKTVRYTGPAAPPITIADAVSDGQWVTDEAGVAQVPAEVADRLVDQDVWRTGGGKAPTIAEVLAEVAALSCGTAEEAAAALGISVRTLEGLVRSKELPPPRKLASTTAPLIEGNGSMPSLRSRSGKLAPGSSPAANRGIVIVVLLVSSRVQAV